MHTAWVEWGQMGAFHEEQLPESLPYSTKLGSRGGQAGKPWPPSIALQVALLGGISVVHCHLLSDVQGLTALSWVQQQ